MRELTSLSIPLHSLPTIIPFTAQSIKYEYTWFKRMPEATIQYKVLDIHGSPALTHNVVLEVDVTDEGIVSGTSLSFDDLLKNCPPQDNNDYGAQSRTLSIRSRFNHQVFYRKPREDGTSDVVVTSLQNWKTSIMTGVTNEDWAVLCEAVAAAHKFLGMSRAFYFRPEIESSCAVSVTAQNTKKMVILSSMMDNLATACNAGIEAIKIFREIPIEDQVILLKEGTVTSAGIIWIYIYDKKYNSFMISAFEDQLFLGVHMNVLRVDPRAKFMEEALNKILHDFEDFLRKDFLVITLMNLMMFFEGSSGVSCEKVIQEEKLKFAKLLDLYILSKIQEWDVPYSRVWDNIYDIIAQFEANKKRQLYETFEREKMMSQSNRDVTHNLAWIEKKVNSPTRPPDFVLLELSVNPSSFLGAVVEVEVEAYGQDDHIIKGTQYSINKLLSRDMSFLKSDTHYNIETETLNSNSFNVMISSRKNPVISSRMEGMNNTLLTRLADVIASARILKGLSVSDCSVVGSSTPTEDPCHQQRIKLSVTYSWPLIMRVVMSFFDSLPSFHLVENQDDRNILVKEAGLEVVLLLWVTIFDKERNSFVAKCFYHSVSLGASLDTFKCMGNTFYNNFHALTHEFDDILRKDEVVMAILASLCLFKTRSGLTSCHRVIEHERNILLILLDKYIRAKVQSNDWITPDNVLWSRIRRDMSRVSALRVLYENSHVLDKPFKSST